MIIRPVLFEILGFVFHPHSGPSSGNRQNIDTLHYSLTPYDSNLPKISEIKKKISFIAHQLKIWRSFKFSRNRWFLTKVFLKFSHFSSDQILDHIRKKCKKSKRLLQTKPKELISAMLMLKFSFKIIKTAAKVTFSENIYSFFLFN